MITVKKSFKTELKTLFSLVLSIVMIFSIAAPAFSEAPVYDVDSEFDPSMEQDPELPPPPPPSQEGFVPGQVTNRPVSQQVAAVNVDHMSVEQRMKRMEQQVNNIQNNDLTQRISSLQNQVQTLQGQVEQLTHQLQQMQTQQKTQYTDLDKRLMQQAAMVKVANNSVVAKKSIASKPNQINATHTDQETESPLPVAKANTKAASNKTVTTSNNKTLANQPNVAEEQEIYQTAYNMIKVKKYNEAVDALKGMLKKYPSGQFASNAHYWLGELYGLMGKNDLALNEFSTVVKSFSDSPRVSDAQLKIGLILASQSKWTEAKSAFKKVINRYPGTASARLASENLKQISSH